MKRLVLLSMGALMLAATVFAPVAMAQEGALDITSATLGTGGSVDVSGTIQCTAGAQYFVNVAVRQTTGNRPFNGGSGSYPFAEPATCTGIGEPDAFTITVVGGKPFKKGTVLVNGFAQVCDNDSCTFPESPLEEFRLR
jgi:hypothetical protein